MQKLLLIICVTILSLSYVKGQNNVDFNAQETWIGYMNVFELPSNGGAYAFGSPWALADLKSVLDAGPNNTLTLQPNFNTYADNPTDAFWVNQSTGEGNKDMDASTFVEPDSATFTGVDLTFSGNVISNTLDAGYQASYFIKALDPANGYQDVFNGSKTFTLPASGQFSVSATAAQLQPGLLIQYGFTIRGRNGNPANEVALGSVVIGATSTSVSTLENVPSLVSVYPNPATDLLTVSSEEPFEKFRVMNVAGVTILEGNNTSSIDISSLNAGTYFVEFILADRREMEPFVKL